MPDMPMTNQRDHDREADVTASELAAFAYCAKAWHLERVVGAEPSVAANRRRDAGVGDHTRHGHDVRVGSWLARHTGSVVIGLALLAILLVFLAVVVG